MKKISLLNNIVVAIVFFIANISFAQVVQVPPGCVVVVPGTGGTAGPNPTGFVGDGGIVSMPDPSGGGSFSFTISGVPTSASWTLRGDLSNTSITPSAINNNPPQPAAGSSANIFTCNKNLRNTESTPPSQSSWGRSKGWVRLAYAQGPCTGKILTFEIFKTFTASPITNVPAIVGPTCLKPNTQYTYSVDPIVSDNINDAIGIDSYYWSGLPAAYASASTTYTSADRSSITFTTGATVTGFTLSCCYGRLNPNTADGGPFTAINQTVVPARTTCVSKTILVAPNQPVFSASTFLSTTASMNATVNPSACLATGQNTFTLTYPNPTVGQTYTWSAPNSGWTFSVSTTATTTLTVNTNGNNNPAQLILTITGNSCDPAITTYQINRNLAAPLAISATGANGTCINATSTGVNTYTFGPNASGIPVTWSIVGGAPPGVTLVNPNSTTVTVNTSGAAVGSFTLQVQASGSVAPCNTAISIPINVKPATPAFTATTPNCVIKGTTAVTNIAVTPVAGATGYTWNLSGAPGWSISAGATTANPTFIPNGTTAGPVTISVTALGVNGCNSTLVSKTINYVSVLTSFNPAVGFTDQYVVLATCGTVSSWVINGTTYTTTTGNITITGNNLAIGGNGGPAITSVCANVTGVGLVCATSLGTHTLRQSDTTIPKEIIENVVVTPNPNNGNFNIKVTDFNEKATATLVDFNGNEIQTYTLQKGDNAIVNDGLKKGNYFIVLIIDGEQDAKQIIVK